MKSFTSFTEDADQDIRGHSTHKLAAIIKDPDHPMHAAAKAEHDRRMMAREATYSDTGWQKPSVKKDKFGNVIKTKNIAKSLAKAAAKQSAGVQNETKGAPKGYHFTRDGKLKKGDAGADGDGGAKLRSDPLDKQRSKVPSLPEAKPDAAEVIRKKQQMAAISTSDKDKLSKIRDMMKRANEAEDMNLKLVNKIKNSGVVKTGSMSKDALVKKVNEAAPKITGDSIKIQRVKDAEHNAAMGRTNTGRKKPVRTMTSTQKSLAKMRGEKALDELSQKTLTSYSTKASDARAHRKLAINKVDNRYAGVAKASKKLDNEKKNKV